MKHVCGFKLVFRAVSYLVVSLVEDTYLEG
jgi:hypothetical protein